MAKAKSMFFCRECGYESSGWLGRCPACSVYNTFVEERIQNTPSSPVERRHASWIGESTDGKAESRPKVIRLADVATGQDARHSSGIHELDRVLGGGFVEGSLVLLGGDPGIGKSTLLLQVLQSGQFSNQTLYVSGEESARQIRLRADRLGVDSNRIHLLSATLFDTIAATITELRPQLAVIDSIQTIYCDDLSSAPGSVGQVRESAAGLLRLAKQLGTIIVLVGHVTKDGAIAGPRVLEHMVDTVLYFEGEQHQSFRVLRAVKNRFGATNEIGLFEMADSGLTEIANASQALLSGRPVGVPGSAVAACIEGTRPILLEVQALLNETAYSLPQRMTSGIDRNRVLMLMAVMEKHGRYGLNAMDAYLNVVGGLRVDEPAADLAIVAALASSFRNRPIRNGTAVFGEIGLAGEIRPVSQADRRVIEASRLGFSTCILPGSCRRALERIDLPDAFDLLFVDRIGDAFDMLF
jgi:DNA repair protein RadA/Sms